jgi:hypothetical protein
MALVLRTVVGRPLTWTEGDDNLTYLEQLVPTPGGVDGELQYNDNGTFSGVPDLTYANSALQATGSFTGSFVGELSGTSSYALTASYALNAPTASYVNLVAGPGITVNGLEITASVRTVNGQLPTNGNIQASLSATKTGDSASFDSSGSGNITASIQDGLVWIIANDATPSWNGQVWIYNSGSVGQWYPIAPLDESASNLLYLRLDGAYPMTGDLDMGASIITNAESVVATTLEGILSSSYVDGPFGANSILSSSYAVSASWSPAGQTFPYTGSAGILGDLAVRGNSSFTATNDGAIKLWNGTNEPSYIQSPFGGLFINNNAIYSSVDGFIRYASNGKTSRVQFEPAGGQIVFFTGPTGTSGSVIAEVDVLRILNNGNIGISNSAPSYRLDVSGSGRYTDGLSVTGSFNVIGTATLTSASVVGDMITNVGDTFATPAVIKIVSLTAAEYSGITPDANTLYVVI